MSILTSSGKEFIHFEKFSREVPFKYSVTKTNEFFGTSLLFVNLSDERVIK
jgi:hypothetical protein